MSLWGDLLFLFLQILRAVSAMLEDCLRVMWVRALVLPQASVLFLDMVDFTRACSAQSCIEAAAWMGRVHHAIDTRIRRHALRSCLPRPLARFPFRIASDLFINLRYIPILLSLQPKFDLFAQSNRISDVNRYQACLPA